MTHFPGFGGTFLFKTPDFNGTDDKFHWTLLLNDFTVPIYNGEIVAQVKSKGQDYAMYVVEMLIEGDERPLYFRVKKKKGEVVTLQDIKPFYAGPQGVFLQKTEDSMGYHWTLIQDDNMGLNFYGDSVVLKLKPQKSFPFKEEQRIE
eukprot:TRINITY_DN2110_c0_g1_i1.p1 TRINITY_DN2110_c0_g1~~TRINITY_DN2110_c0_g1_i1.p1  ORF type:complete len:147 (-),score=31.21 TRINITY_DN2110_c0_g1_i1:49-489(-)